MSIAVDGPDGESVPLNMGGRDGGGGHNNGQRHHNPTSSIDMDQAGFALSPASPLASPSRGFNGDTNTTDLSSPMASPTAAYHKPDTVSPEESPRS